MATSELESPLQPGRSGIREVWSQAWPTVATMTSYTVMGFVDALMVARLGPLEVAAQGNGGIVSGNICKQEVRPVS